jgi:OOP family OmpA-OmpF porin
MHSKKRALLADFSGDPDDFLDLEPDVRKLLQSGKKEEEAKKFPWPAVLALVVAGIAFGYWQWLGQQVINEQQAKVANLEASPGVVILESDYSRDSLYLEFMMDPDGDDPKQFFEPENPDYSVDTREIMYLSIEPELILRRAKRILEPQPSTTIDFDAGIIKLTGTATVNWVAEATKNWPSISGAERLDISRLNIIDPELNAIRSLIDEAESVIFEFETGNADLDTESASFQSLASTLLELVAKANDYGATLTIDIVGFTDSSGTDRVNRIIALNRAETLKLYLMDEGIPGNILEAFRGQDYEGGSVTVPGTSRETHLVIKVTR